MSEDIDDLVGYAAKDRDGENKQFSDLIFPSEHQIVILESDIDKASQKNIPRIPLMFQIKFNGAAKDPPALLMLVNPDTLNVSRDRKINSEFTRGGHVVEEWGLLQENLQFSGKIGGYYVLNPSQGMKKGESTASPFSGLNRYHRSKSPSFKNLMNLFMIYRNNGMVYAKTIKEYKFYGKIKEEGSENRLIKNSGLSRANDRIPKMIQNAKNRIATVGDIYLFYDGVVYKGSFDDFSIEESADNPYFLNYKFTFIVQSKVETDKRSVETYTQRFYEVGDLDKNKTLSKQQRRNLEAKLDRIVKTGISTSEISETASVSLSNNVSPVATRDQIQTQGVLIEKISLQVIGNLENQGIKLDSNDKFSIKQDVSTMNSSDAGVSNKGQNDSVKTFQTILSKNGKESNEKAAGLAAETRSTLTKGQKKVAEANKKEIK